MNANFVDIESGHNKSITIIPIELHWSRRTRSNGFCNETWAKTLKRIEKDPNCRVIFVGDLIDADRPSSRERKFIMGLGRPEMLDEDDMNHMDELDHYLIPQLKRIKDKIIGMVDGDHFRVFGSKTSTQYICEKLGIPKAYLGERMGWIRISFRHKRDMCSFDIFVRHGRGGVGAFGNDVNAMIRQNQGFIADLYVGGHTHKQWFIKVPHLYCGKHEIKQKLVGYARAGSMLRGFLYGQSTYAEVAEYSPLHIGCPEISVITTRAGHINNGNLIVSDIKGLT